MELIPRTLLGLIIESSGFQTPQKSLTSNGFVKDRCYQINITSFLNYGIHRSGSFCRHRSFCVTSAHLGCDILIDDLDRFGTDDSKGEFVSTFTITLKGCQLLIQQPGYCPTL
jgi:hypothetical protein